MEIQRLVNEYAAATDEALRAMSEATFDLLDRRVGDGWSARQVIHHLADAETNSYIRLRRLLAEAPGTTIQGYDEAAWAECAQLGYQQLPVEHAVALFAAVRQGSLDVLRRVTERDLGRTGEHTESGRYTLADWLRIYTAHPRDHVAQMREAMSA
jgi:hypothetical protein